jgi:hypothetical protein
LANWKRIVVAWFVAMAIATIPTAVFLGLYGQWECVGIAGIFLAVVFGLTILMLLQKEQPRTLLIPKPGSPGSIPPSSANVFSRIAITMAARHGEAAVPPPLRRFLRPGGSPWLRFTRPEYSIWTLYSPAGLSALQGEGSDRYAAYEFHVENSRKDGGQTAAEVCEATLFLPDGTAHHLPWPSKRTTETIELGSVEDVEVFAVDSRRRFVIAPASRGYFANGPDDCVKIPKFPVRLNLKVICANGDPIEASIEVRKIFPRDMEIKIGIVSQQFPDNFTFTYKGKKYPL